MRRCVSTASAPTESAKYRQSGACSQISNTNTGTPSRFELLTRDFAPAVAFYRTVFGWETDVVSDTDEFRYTTVRGPGGAGHELAGVGDASGFLPEGVPSHWSIYWHVDDVDAALAAVQSLGGSVVRAGEDTPYGRLAEAADPAGAHFKLRTPPA